MPEPKHKVSETPSLPPPPPSRVGVTKEAALLDPPQRDNSASPVRLKTSSFLEAFLATDPLPEELEFSGSLSPGGSVKGMSDIARSLLSAAANEPMNVLPPMVASEDSLLSSPPKGRSFSASNEKSTPPLRGRKANEMSLPSSGRKLSVPSGDSPIPTVPVNTDEAKPSEPATESTWPIFALHTPNRSVRSPFGKIKQLRKTSSVKVPPPPPHERSFSDSSLTSPKTRSNSAGSPPSVDSKQATDDGVRKTSQTVSKSEGETHIERRSTLSERGRLGVSPTRASWDWPEVSPKVSSTANPVRELSPSVGRDRSNSIMSPAESRARSRSRSGFEARQKAVFTDFSMPLPFEGCLVKLILKVDSQVLAQFEFVTITASNIIWTGSEEIHLTKPNPDITFELLHREFKGCPAATFVAAASSEPSMAKAMSFLNDHRNWYPLGKVTVPFSLFLAGMRNIDGTENLTTIPIVLTSNGVNQDSQITARIDMLDDELVKHSGKRLPSTSTRIRPEPLRVSTCKDLSTLAFTFEHLDNPKPLTGAELAEVHQSWNRIRVEFQELATDTFTNFLFLIYPKAAQLYEPMCNMQWGKKWIEFLLAVTDKLPNNPRKMDRLFADSEQMIYDLGRQHGLLRFPREFYLYAGDAMCRVVVRLSASFNQLYDPELTRSGFHSFWSALANRLWRAHQAQQPTEEEAKLVVASWGEVQAKCTSLVKFGMEFYRMLFSEHPETLDIFGTTNMDGQMAHLGYAVNTIVTGFKSPQFESKIKQLSISHLNHMIQPRHFNIVGQTLLKTVVWALGRPLTAEEKTAWVTIFTQISACISWRSKVALELEEQATDWLEQMAHEMNLGPQYVEERVHEIRAEIIATGSYTHTYQELSYGAKVGWRNAAKCPGRIQWNNMVVRDMRHLSSPDAIFQAICKHLKMANDNGVIKTTMTVFPVKPPGSPLGVRIWNDQVIRYAGYQIDEDTVIGDPGRIPLTDKLIELGWTPPEPKGHFDILPLAIECPGYPPRLFQLPLELVPEVFIEHPQYTWFKDLGLKWYTIPLISGFAMEIGGLTYSCFPFNGWYMSSEIGRNLVERYGMDKVVAEKLGMDTTSDRTLWADAVSLIVHQAVMYSFTKAGVSMVDHNTCSKQWVTHAKRELRLGRETPADWAWVVPPLGSQAITWHQTMRYFWLKPAYGHQVEVWSLDTEADSKYDSSVRERKRPRLVILFGSETGKAESFANAAANKLLRIFDVSITTLDEADWATILGYSEKAVLVVTSTFGQGEPPSNAKQAWATLSAKTLDFTGVPFAVFALGSRMYPEFAAFGKAIDQLLTELGGARLLSTGLADELLGQDTIWKTWSQNFYTMLSQTFHGGLIADSVDETVLEVRWVDEKSQDPLMRHPSRPIPSIVHVNEELMLKSAAKSVRKIYFQFDQTMPSYDEGDHLSVWPENLPSSVDQMLGIFKLDGDKTFCIMPKKGKIGKPPFTGSCSVRDALAKVFDLQLFNYSPTQLALLLRELDRFQRAEGMRNMITELESPDADIAFSTKDAILDFCCTVGDLVNSMCSSCPFAKIVPVLLILQPRRYSISTGPKAHPGVVGITVAVVDEVRASGSGYPIKGVCSNYLTSRKAGDHVYVKIQKANFQLPKDTRDIIMVGPGTGIAPFRAFLAERKEAFKATDGKIIGSEAVLFFGCRNRQEDFLYKSEVQDHLGFHSDPVFEALGPNVSLPLSPAVAKTALSEFHIAPSRESSTKTYVQHLISAHGQTVIARLLSGASFYICGDIRMAQDVKAALLEAAVRSGKFEYEQAIAFFDDLALKGRYQTDVWGVTASVSSVNKEARENVKNRARDWMVSVSSGKVKTLTHEDYDVS